MAILFISHDLGVISQVSDEVLVMYLGRIMERADVESLMSDPQHPYTTGLLNAIPRLDRRGQRLEAVPGTVPGNRDRDLSGCPFEPRCAQRLGSACSDRRPQMLGRIGGGSVACHLHDPAVATGDPEPVKNEDGSR
jgi:oligopeptide/dipeptide ABC transporter ATP-binding protein